VLKTKHIWENLTLCRVNTFKKVLFPVQSISGILSDFFEINTFLCQYKCLIFLDPQVYVSVPVKIRIFIVFLDPLLIGINIHMNSSYLWM